MKPKNEKKVVTKGQRTPLVEGIDIIPGNGSRTISVTNNHQRYVDTNNHQSPYLFADTQKGYKVLSIFQRKSTGDKLDSNPLLNALKQRNGWEFADARRELHILLRNFVAASSLLPQYDTMIMTPSNNDLNKTVFMYLRRLIRHNHSFENFFEKYLAQDVYDYLIDDKYIESRFKNPAKVFNDLDEAIARMNLENDGVFSYKYLQKSAYRDVIIQSMKVNMGAHNDLNYADYINGKDVLVFDDTITTGKTISDSGNAIKDMFAPKSITFVTLFSAIDDQDKPTQQKINRVEESNGVDEEALYESIMQEVSKMVRRILAQRLSK